MNQKKNCKRFLTHSNIEQVEWKEKKRRKSKKQK